MSDKVDIDDLDWLYREMVRVPYCEEEYLRLLVAFRTAWPAISAELRELRDEVEKQKNLNSQLMGKIFAVKPELIELRARLEDDGK